MDKYKVLLVYGSLLILKYCAALEYNKRPINANTDFLFHESGGTVNYGNQNGGKMDYNSQFPALGPVVTAKTTSIPVNNDKAGTQQGSHSSSGMRDYVAPQWPIAKPNENNRPTTPKISTTPRIQGQSSNGKRDYVAPVTSKSTTTRNYNNNNSGTQQNLPSSNGKRNYVAPQKPTQNINNQPNKNSEPLPGLPTKPMSFSSVVAGGNRPTSAVTLTTAKPTAFTSSIPGARPGSLVLPSAILNNNANRNNGNTVTDDELKTLSEELLRKDSNNAARYITINYQEKTTSHSKEDKAPQPLLTVSPEAWNIPTVQKFIPLLDNYERDAQVNEHVTPQERIEENAFMDAVMSTSVMRHLMTFLKNKGYVSLDIKQQRDFVKQMWFTLYSRSKGKTGSSGFEHVFLSELKNGGILGLHNWIYYAREEAANRLNYLGYLKYSEFNDKGAVVIYHLDQQGIDKPVNGMFVGTSPELELALYTLCFVTRVDNDCWLKLANKDVNIITYNYRYRSKNLVGSAFPQI